MEWALVEMQGKIENLNGEELEELGALQLPSTVRPAAEISSTTALQKPKPKVAS